MTVKKETTKKSTIKKDAPIAKKTKKIDLKDFSAEVEAKASEIYRNRVESGISGDDLSDWFQAEKEIKEKYNL